MIELDNVKSFLIEHTSRCNLRCPMCARTDNKILTNGDIQVKDYQRLFTKDLCESLSYISLCGCYGDPVASPTLFDSLKYFRDNNVNVNIHTNGCLRESNWWRELAKIMNKESIVIFAIDGITNEINKINRVNSNLKIIMRNVKAFIEAGGYARWDYLIFEHNKHQLDDAKKMAEDMGFVIFNARYTTAGVTNKHFRESLYENYYKGSDKQFINLLNKYGSWKNYINKTPIECKAIIRKELYIDYELNLWPCSWIGAPYFTDPNLNIQKKQLLQLDEKYGKGFNSLKGKSIKEVLNHEWFQKGLIESWEKQYNEKMTHCAKMCGSDYRASTTEKCNRTMTYFFERNKSE